jgi:all-trans-retinol 13,14-reductase
LGFTHYSTILLPERLRSLSDYSRNAALLAGPPAKHMPVMAIADYSAIESGLNAAGAHLVSVVGVDRMANWEGLDARLTRASVINGWRRSPPKSIEHFPDSHVPRCSGNWRPQ